MPPQSSGNSNVWVAIPLFRIWPWHREAVMEVGIGGRRADGTDRPFPEARYRRCDIDHSWRTPPNFANAGGHARRKGRHGSRAAAGWDGYFNGDDPHVMWMATQTKALGHYLRHGARERGPGYGCPRSTGAAGTALHAPRGRYGSGSPHQAARQAHGLHGTVRVAIALLRDARLMKPSLLWKRWTQRPAECGRCGYRAGSRLSATISRRRSKRYRGPGHVCHHPGLAPCGRARQYRGAAGTRKTSL